MHRCTVKYILYDNWQVLRAKSSNIPVEAEYNIFSSKNWGKIASDNDKRKVFFSLLLNLNHL
jgi:hypothetical protein